MVTATHNQRVLRHSTTTPKQRKFWLSSAKFRLFVGGVGSGKTRAGVVEVLRMPPDTTGMVLAPTYPMLRDATMRTFLDLARRGGVLAEVNKSEMTVTLVDGKRILFRSADDPDRLRGPNLGWFYLDEAALMAPDVWLIMIGRLRELPGKGWATSTPRGKNWLYHTFHGHGVDYDVITSSSRENPFLPPAFIHSLETAYTSRFARQEIGGEFIDDVEGALWTRKLIDDLRVLDLPLFKRIVVALDPTGTTGGDEAGIIVAGLGVDGHGYILDDRSLHGSPDQWGRQTVTGYHLWKADRVVAEVNYGGEMVEHVIRTIDDKVAYSTVHASRGKYVRAEPVSHLYERGLVHHVGVHAKLEDELTNWTPGDASPNRLDALVWALTELMLDDTPAWTAADLRAFSYERA